MTSLLKTLMTFSILSSFLHAQEISENPAAPVSPIQVCLDCFSNFKAQENIAFPTTQKENKKWDTQSVLIIQDEQIVYERYNKNTSQNAPQRLWSMSKSISSLLIGIRSYQNKIKLDQRLPHFFAYLENQPFKRDITIKNLLRMTSGIEWQEVYETNPLNSDVIKMLYLEENKNMASYVLSTGQRYRPGKYFYYSSGETNLLMAALKKTFPSIEDYQDFPWQHLFNPLDIQTASWETDKSGTFVGSSYLFMSARDLAKIGQLVLNKGIHKEERLLSQEYLDLSFTPSSASCTTELAPNALAYSYGLGWWLNSPCLERKQNPKAFEQLPDDLIMALGHHGQTLAIFPSQNTIAIRFGADKSQPFPRGQWLEEVYKGIAKQKQRSSSL